MSMIHWVHLLICCVIVSLCGGCSTPQSPTVVDYRRWGRCGELRKDEIYEIAPAGKKYLKEEVFYSSAGYKVFSVKYDSPGATLITYDKDGGVLKRQTKNIFWLMRDAVRDEYQLFPVISKTEEGYQRVDYYNKLLGVDDGYETSIYFDEDGCPVNIFERVQLGMTEAAARGLLGDPRFAYERVGFIEHKYYAPDEEITLEYKGGKIVDITRQRR